MITEIKTARLILKPFKSEDFSDYQRQITSNVEVMQNLLPHKSTITQRSRVVLQSLV